MRIDDDRVQAGIVIGLAVKEENARLRGDGYPNRIGHLQAACPLEVFLRQENLDMSLKLITIGQREIPNEGNVPLNDLSPRIGELASAYPLPPLLPEPPQAA